MKSSNKTNQDIRSFLGPNQLFRREKAPPTISHSYRKSANPTTAGPITLSPSPYQRKYYLLNELQQKQRRTPKGNQTARSEIIERENEKITHHPFSQVDRRENQSHHKESQTNHELTKAAGSIGTEVVRQEQIRTSPVERQLQMIGEQERFNTPTKGERISLETWQDLIVNSSQRYFDSCRNEALEYLMKTEGVLIKDLSLINSALENIREQVNSFHLEEGQKMRKQLYQVVDAVVESWVNQKISSSGKSEVDYLGEIFELRVQIESRLEQTKEFRREMDSARNWRNRASDLLSSNFQQSILELSLQCRKSIEEAERNTKGHILLSEKLNWREWDFVRREFTEKMRYFLSERSHFEIEYQALQKHATQRRQVKYEHNPSNPPTDKSAPSRFRHIEPQPKS